MKSIDEKVLDAYRSSVLNERKDINEAYKVAQNPSDKLWYALGSVGKYWMPVSSGYKSKKEAEKFAKTQPMVDKKERGFVKEDNELSEASEITLDEAEPYVREFIEKLFKNTTYKVDKQVIFDGIHGIIVNLVDQFNTPNIRLRKTDLKKIMADKNVRWVDIAAVGM